jgi:hypothetical protein
MFIQFNIGLQFAIGVAYDADENCIYVLIGPFTILIGSDSLLEEEK